MRARPPGSAPIAGGPAGDTSQVGRRGGYVDERSLAYQLLTVDDQDPRRSPGERRGFGQVPWTWVDLVVVSLFAMATQLALVPAGMTGVSHFAARLGGGSALAFFAQSVTAYSVTVGALWVMALRRHRASWQSLGYRPVDTRGLAGLLALLAATVFGVNMLARLVIDLPRLQDPFLLGHGRGSVLLIAILVIVVAPLAEETLFRGFLLQGLARRFRFWPAAFISSAAFALAHVWPHLYPPVFLLGLAFSWLFWRTGSLWTAIAAHATLNTTAFVIAWLVGPP